MRLQRLLSMAQRGLALDTETHRLSEGLLTPPIVCGSAGWLAPGPRVEGALLSKEQVIEAFARALDDPDAILIGANIAFDLATFIVELARRGVDAAPWVFKAFEEQRVYDIQVAEALHAIAEGHLGKDPRTGQELKNPETGKRGSYSLYNCVKLVLGREDAKVNDDFRLRYHELENIPMEQWPQVARDYPIDDAKGTIEVALAQIGALPKVSPRHEWCSEERAIIGADGHPVLDERGATRTAEYSYCSACGATRISAPCVVRRPHHNLHQVADQTYSAFCLHLGAAWGFRVDQSAVDVIERYYTKKRNDTIAPFIQAGVLRPNEKENRSILKRLIAAAYGATEPCPHCAGTGKIPHPKQPTLVCPGCKGRSAPWKSKGQLMAPTVASCAQCASSGRVPHHKTKLMGCVILGEGVEISDEESEDDEEDEKPGKTITCDGTGFLLPVTVPRSDKGGIAYGGDSLTNSGDEFLMGYGVFLVDQKILASYVPFLRSPRIPAAGHAQGCPRLDKNKKGRAGMCTCPGPYIEVPLTLRPNPVLDTLRVSYAGLMQLFPRAPGFVDKPTGEYIPSLRECIVARGPRYETVEMPDDYVLQPGELAC